MNRSELLISISCLKLPPASGRYFGRIHHSGGKKMSKSVGICRAVWNYRLAAVAIAIAAVLLLGASGAKAGCALPTTGKHSPMAAWPGYRETSEWSGPATIVGLWHVIYKGDYDYNFPPGGPYPPVPFIFLESFKTWHADGTEFENAFLSPEGGNICFGVWKEETERCVKLHHIGLMFTSEGKVSSIFTVDETDTVAPDGKSYSGTFDFKLWPPSYDAVGKGTPISEVRGSTAATRITVD
jgi:hypothetical protein